MSNATLPAYKEGRRARKRWFQPRSSCPHQRLPTLEKLRSLPQRSVRVIVPPARVISPAPSPLPPLTPSDPPSDAVTDSPTAGRLLDLSEPTSTIRHIDFSSLTTKIISNGRTVVNLAHIATSDSSPDQPSHSNTSGDAENAPKSSSLPSPLPDHSSGDEYDSDCPPPLIPLSDDEDFDPSSSDPSSSDSDDTSSVLSFTPNIPHTSDASSSDSDHPAPLIPIRKRVPSTMSNVAILEHASLTTAPILQPGVYTVDVFNEFREAFDSFFLYKKVADDARVLMALSALRGPAMKSWIRLISASTTDPIANWTWDHFMAQLKSKWLPENWALQVKRLRNAAQGKRPWFEFQLAVRGANENLLGLPGYLSNTDIRLHLEERMSDDLAEAYLKANRDHHLEQITDLDRWLDEVRVLDDDIRKEASRGKRLFKLLMAETGPSSAHAASEKKQRLPRAETSTGTTSTTPQASGSTDTKEVGRRPPRLTADERDLLMKHLGCFTCRQFYTDHIAPDCKAGSPEHATYRTLTESDALAAKSAYETKKANAIAGIQLRNSSVLDDDEDMIGNSSDSGEGPDFD